MHDRRSAMGKVDGGHTVDGHFAGKGASVREVYDRFLTVVR
jgi:hypothetical protein